MEILINWNEKIAQKDFPQILPTNSPLFLFPGQSGELNVFNSFKIPYL
jgi:hypothetical protein